MRAFRIGIDVGGTFTKAVLIDNATRLVVGRHSVKTTHDHERGVADGVVQVFRNVLAESGVRPDEVVFLAHSTTQATNALLEGDVARVGIVGMAGRAAAHLAEPQVRIGPIDLGAGRSLETINRFLVIEEAGEADIAMAIRSLADEGAEVLVASSAFGVDTTGSEEAVARLGAGLGLPTTCGHEITRLYGLATRTRTAVINASILPRMIATAAMTEASVREAGITAPLMIMRGDGGVMDIAEMRRRPAMTMLSGPAASVAGALMHLKVADGIYFEVGGTSTNIGVIRNGRPTVAYAHVGGHETYVSSLDVRVAGVAGGSMIRVGSAGIVDVGPRSAHIAGLGYAAFASEAELAGARIELIVPRAGDSADHVALRTSSGALLALTTTCAANALGFARPGHHAHGNPAAARSAFRRLGAYLAMDGETAARRVLEVAASKVVPIVQGLVRDYQLDADQCLLVGEGGGAASLVPFVAELLGLRHEISRDAEVISSIGVALALVRDVVERVVPHPKPEDLQAIRHEAHEAAVRLGADPREIEVTVEVDPLTHRVRAIAVGAAEMHVKDSRGAISAREAAVIAARSLGVATEQVRLVADTLGLRVFVDAGRSDGPVRAVDDAGAIRVQRSRAIVEAAKPGASGAVIRRLWQAVTDGAERSTPAGFFLLHGRHVTDLSGVETADQAMALAASDLAGAPDDATIALVAQISAAVARGVRVDLADEAGAG